ncbi:MAG TPA: PEP-CTERM sorting domain-containing protein [Cyanobacteria bacterium UBA11162]|nr:PEP-CTERM sorting domain-containing protein [Cyanobacteria bacterium UBA11162]
MRSIHVPLQVFSVLALGCVFTSSAYATTVKFDSFSNPTGLTLNGNAAVVNTSDGDVLRLTPATFYQFGSAFSSTTISASTFSTFFKFRITNPGGRIGECNTESGADGLVFVAQSVSSSIGGVGEGIGYKGIPNSVGVEFDTWCNNFNNDPSSNHIGIDTGGNVNHGVGAPFTVNVSPNFDDGNIWYAWIDYNGTNLEVRTNQTGLRPVDALLSRTLDIPSLLGGVENAYVGFTSGTGGDYGNHDILSWEYHDTFDPMDPKPVPEPSATVPLVGLGLMSLGFMYHRRKSN